MGTALPNRAASFTGRSPFTAHRWGSDARTAHVPTSFGVQWGLMFVRTASIVCAVAALGLAALVSEPPTAEAQGPTASGAASSRPASRPTPSGLPVPRFVSLKFAETNGREGPSFEHPIVWRYLRQGLPLEVVAETENWRKVRDPNGDLVWIHRRTLSSQRMVVVHSADGEPVELHRTPGGARRADAVIEPGVVFRLGACLDGWCRVDGVRATGWLAVEHMWGVYPEEAA